MKLFSTWWKYSRWRFYYLNAQWNIKFWLFCKKVYKDVNYNVQSDDYVVNYANVIIEKKKVETKKRFAGFMYENGIYLDNPGIQNIDRETWKAWRKKGFIK